MEIATTKEQDRVARWKRELVQAQKRQKKFIELGAEAVQVYECKDREKVPFNILFANTETQAPVVYNQTPRPVVKRRYHDDDPAGLVAGKVLQRLAEYMLDDNIPNYTTFDQLMQKSVHSALVPGRGVIRWKYDALLAEVQTEAGPEKQVASEYICGELVPWNRVFYNYAQTWAEVTWIAFEHQMTKAEVEKQFGAAIAAKVGYGTPVLDDEHSRDNAGPESGQPEVAFIYEIWDKATKKVFFLENSVDTSLKETDDPYQLAGFFPCGEFLQYIARISCFDPLPFYEVYREQAEELNAITKRLKPLIKAMRVRGAYDGTVEGLGDVLGAEENTLKPLDNVAALDGQALDKALWLVPFERWSPVVQQLYMQREQVKGIIYEISGIADIMRGNTQASETLGAQELKTQWGTIRIRRAQKETERFVVENLRLMVEMAVKRLSVETLAAITQVRLPREVEKQQLAAQMQQMQGMGQQIPPELVQAAQIPSWEGVHALLKDDTERSYRLDIETNSTLEPDANEDKQDFSELLNAIAQFFNGVAPLVQNGIMPMEAAKGVLLGIVRRFRLGPEVEEALSQISQPQQPGGGPGGEQAPEPDPELEVKKAEAQMRLQMIQQEGALKAEELQLKQQELRMKAELAKEKHTAQLESIRLRAQAQAQSARMQLERQLEGGNAAV